MVGGDGVDRAVDETAAHLLHVAHRAKRRVHLEQGVEAAKPLVGEADVMRRRLGGDGESVRFRRSHQLNAAGGR